MSGTDRTPTSPIDDQMSLTVGDDLLVESGDLCSRCTAADVRRGLERRYGDGWLVLHEVANHLGHLPSERSAELATTDDHRVQTKRYLDTIAVGMYRSTGYEIIGHEIKVSRADWLSERRKPHKAAAFAKLVSRFYLVAPKGVVQPGELPDGWGLLTFYPSRIVVTKVAPCEDPAIPLSFIAALLARCNDPKKTA